jgi:hypothetical protein
MNNIGIMITEAGLGAQTPTLKVDWYVSAYVLLGTLLT